MTAFIQFIHPKFSFGKQVSFASYTSQIHLFAGKQVSFASYFFSLHYMDCIHKNHLFSLSLSLIFCFCFICKKQNDDCKRKMTPKVNLFYLLMWQIKTEYSVEKTMSEEKTVWSVDDEGRGRPCLFSWFWISDWFYFWLIFNQI